MEETKNSNNHFCHCTEILNIWWIKSLIGFFIFLLIFFIGSQFVRHFGGREFNGSACGFGQSQQMQNWPRGIRNEKFNNRNGQPFQADAQQPTKTDTKAGDDSHTQAATQTDAANQSTPAAQPQTIK